MILSFFSKYVFRKMGIKWATCCQDLLFAVWPLAQRLSDFLQAGQAACTCRVWRAGGSRGMANTLFLSRKYLQLPKAGCFDGKVQRSKPWKVLEFDCLEILEGCGLIAPCALRVLIPSVDLCFANLVRSNWCNVFYLTKRSINSVLNTTVINLALSHWLCAARSSDCSRTAGADQWLAPRRRKGTSSSCCFATLARIRSVTRASLR